MPIFDYKCADCGNEFEKIVRSEVVDVECPLCGAIAERKEVSFKGGFVLKGEGFYKPSPVHPLDKQ